MLLKIIPAIAEKDYEELKRLCLNMPPSYEEWLKQQQMGKGLYKNQGYQVREILIEPQELRNYCKAMRFTPALAVLSHFAMAKNIQNLKRKKR